MIYLDHNATTPVLPSVIEAITHFLAEAWGNPSSRYRFSEPPRKALGTARAKTASLINASPPEIVFTSGATESNNTALHSALLAQPSKRHIVTSSTEHSSVLATCSAYEKLGYRVTHLSVNREGLISIDDLESAIEPDTAIVSLMWANNETGVLFPTDEIADSCRARGTLFHCDAVQAVGKFPVDMQSVRADYLSISGHKFGAPKGIGALYVRSTAPFIPLIQGGGQERDRRGGTENIPYIVGLGVAAETAEACLLKGAYIKVEALRDTLEKEICDSIRGAEVNGHLSERLPNTTNIHLPGLDNTAVLAMLDQAGICASSGSACMKSSITPSHVISAMTKSRKHAEESIRFSLGLSNTLDEIIETANRIRMIVGRMA